MCSGKCQMANTDAPYSQSLSWKTGERLISQVRSERKQRSRPVQPRRARQRLRTSTTRRPPRSSFRMEPCLLLVAPYRRECGCQSDALAEDTAHARPKSVSRCERFSRPTAITPSRQGYPFGLEASGLQCQEITAAIDRTACWSDVETDS